MIINFNQELTEEFGNVIVEQLLDIYTKNESILDANSRLRYREDYLPLYTDEISFMINSPGGSLYSFIQIWDVIDKLKGQGVKIIAEVSSHCFSAGFYLFMLADERRMNKLGLLLYHEMSISNAMKLSDWSLETNRMAKIQQALDDLVTKNSKITQEMLDSYKGKDMYIDYDMAVEYEIIKEEKSKEEMILSDDEKDIMTQSEFDAFVEEIKELINIVPDNEEEVEGESLDDEDEQEDNKIKELEDIEEVEYECVEPANCEKYKGSRKCCKFCEDKSDCKFNICAYAFDKEECGYIKNN